MGKIILPHSFNPGSVSIDVWRHVVWGTPAHGVFGRLSYAIRLFLDFYRVGIPTRIYLGNGAFISEDGRSESEFTRDYALENLHQIPGFEESHFKDELQSSMFLESIFGQNTRGEIEGCFAQCARMDDVDHLILVTSPFHAPRSYRDALALREERRISVRISAEASDTDPLGCSPQDVIIQEPRHRKP